jgi:toxin-antitoxin system PIN domain toxin
MRMLLDVNVLVALLDSSHAFSTKAYQWIDTQPRQVATCPIVENGVVRVMSSPGYSATHRATPSRIALALQAMVRQLDHQFWPDDTSILDEKAFNVERLHGHRQITDAYLLALAVRRRGGLATFDAAVALSAVHGATKRHLTLL